MKFNILKFLLILLMSTSQLKSAATNENDIDVKTYCELITSQKSYDAINSKKYYELINSFKKNAPENLKHILDPIYDDLICHDVINNHVQDAQSKVQSTKVAFKMPELIILGLLNIRLKKIKPQKTIEILLPLEENLVDVTVPKTTAMSPRVISPSVTSPSVTSPRIITAPIIEPEIVTTTPKESSTKVTIIENKKVEAPKVGLVRKGMKAIGSFFGL